MSVKVCVQFRKCFIVDSVYFKKNLKTLLRLRALPLTRPDR